MAKGPREAFLIDTEFAHIHPDYDGSLHMCLPEDVQARALSQGWGETHMLAGKTVGGLDVSARNTMIFGPRDSAEAEIVWRLVLASYTFACG
jgi:phospholipase/carboxylesterase